MNHSNPRLSAPGYLFEGFSRLMHPALRWYVLIPLAINVVVFIALFSVASDYFSQQLAVLQSSLPTWLSFLSYLLWPLFFILMAAVMFFTFTLIGNIVAAPFNALLSEAVQRMEGANLPESSWGDLLTIIPKSLGREFKRLLYILPRMVLLALFSMIPIVGIIAGLGWFIFNGWMMAIQYCDYAADNRGISFNEMLQRKQQKSFKLWLFGITVNFAMLIPLLNLLIIPSAVVGGTLMWERELEQQ